MQKIKDFQIKHGLGASKYGFTQISNLLIREHLRLGLSSREASVLIYFLSYDYNLDAVACPSIAEMARRSDMSYSTLHRYKDRLIEKRFITDINKNNRYGTKTYSLFGTYEKLRQLAERLIDDDFVFGKISEEDYSKLMADETMKKRKDFAEGVP